MFIILVISILINIVIGLPIIAIGTISDNDTQNVINPIVLVLLSIIISITILSCCLLSLVFIANKFTKNK